MRSRAPTVRHRPVTGSRLALRLIFPTAGKAICPISPDDIPQHIIRDFGISLGSIELIDRFGWVASKRFSRVHYLLEYTRQFQHAQPQRFPILYVSSDIIQAGRCASFPHHCDIPSIIVQFCLCGSATQAQGSVYLTGLFRICRVQGEPWTLRDLDQKIQDIANSHWGSLDETSAGISAFVGVEPVAYRFNH